MALNYLSGGEAVNHTWMNSLFSELDTKMSTMLAGVDSLGAKQPGKSFVLAFPDSGANRAELLRLMGKTFFFLSGASVYSRTVPGFVDLGLGNAGKSYDHSVFTAAAAAATIIASDTTNHIATINKLGTTADGNIQTGTWWTDIGYTHNHYVSLFDYSLQAHTIDVSGTPYYIRESYTGSNVPQGTFACVPEKKLELGLAEIIIEGPTSVTIETAWNKYRCWRIHNLSQNACTVTIHGTAFVIPRWGCRTIRKLANGSFVNPYYYFVEFQAGDPLFFWFWRSFMTNPYVDWGRFRDIDTSNQQPTATNSMYANNIANPAVLHDYIDSLSRQSNGLHACFIRDITVLCDNYSRYQSVYGDPSNSATLIGDLIHHKGSLLVVRIYNDIDPATGLNRVVTNELAFNGYSTIVADFAAQMIAVSIDGNGVYALSSTEPDSTIYLLTVSTNLLKRGENIPDAVDLGYNGAGGYTLETAIFDDLVGVYQGYHDAIYTKGYHLSWTHPVVIKLRTIVTAANEATAGNAHKVNWMGAYNAATVYAAGDMVSCRGQYWYSVGATPAGNTPAYYAANGTDPNEYWGRLEGYASVWTAGAYKKADLVQGVKASPTAIDGMLIWYANSDTSDTPPPVGSPANGWNIPDIQGGDPYHIGSGWEVIDVGNESEQVPIAVELAVEEIFTGTPADSTVFTPPTTSPPQFQPAIHTVGDLLNLATGSLFRDSTQTPDSIAVFDSASLTMTPTGLVLLFRERMPNNNSHTDEFGAMGSRPNNYGEQILPPNTTGLGLCTLLHSAYQVSVDGLWLDRWRRINFRGHGWGYAQRIAVGDFTAYGIYEAITPQIPAQHGSLFQSPVQGRAVCVQRVRFGDLPDGKDFELVPLSPSKTGIKLCERKDYNRNARCIDDRMWVMTEAVVNFTDIIFAGMSSYPGTNDRKNANIRNDMRYRAFQLSQPDGPSSQTEQSAAPMLADHWNALAEAVNQCTRAIPLSWQCLKFYYDGEIRGLYDPDLDFMHDERAAYPSVSSPFRPMDSFCGVNSLIDFTNFGDPNPQKAFYQSLGIPINSGPPSGLPALYSQQRKYRSVNFPWESEVEAFHRLPLTVDPYPADQIHPTLGPYTNTTPLVSQVDYQLSISASLGSETDSPMVDRWGNLTNETAPWLWDGPLLQQTFSGIEWVSIDDVKDYAETLGFGFSYAEIIEPYEAVAFSVNDSISDGTFDAPVSGVSASWHGAEIETLLAGFPVAPVSGVYSYNLGTPYQAHDMTYGFTLTTATFAPYDATQYLVTPAVDESHNAGVQLYLVHYEYEYTANPGVFLNAVAWWCIGTYPYDNTGYPNPAGAGFTAPKIWFDGLGVDRITQITSLVAATSDQTYHDPSLTRDIGTVPPFCSGVETLQILSAGVVFSQHNLPAAPKWKRVLARMNAVPDNYWNASTLEAYERTNRGYVAAARSGNENVLVCEHPAFHEFRVGQTADSLPSNPDGYGPVVGGITSDPITGPIYGKAIAAFVGNAIPADYATHIPTTYKSMERGECYKAVKMGGTSEHFTTVALGEKKIIGVQMYASTGVSISVNLNYLPKGFWTWTDGAYDVPDAYESAKEKYLRVQTQYKHADVAGYQSNVAQTVFSNNGGDGGFGYYGFTGSRQFGGMQTDADMFDLEWVDPTWPGFKGVVALTGGGNISSTGAPGGTILTSGVNLLSPSLHVPSSTYQHGSMYEVRAQLAYTVAL